MITLGGNNITFAGELPAGARSVIRLSNDPARPLALKRREAFLLGLEPAPAGFAVYVAIDGRGDVRCAPNGGPTAQLPTEFNYLDDGDVIRLEQHRGAIRVLFRRSSSMNSFLLTERCNNYCLMCSQPPRNVEDGWIVDEILDALPLIDPGTPEIMFSGGEPTLLGPRFLELVRACKSYLPNTALHVLSNGRKFAEPQFAADLARINHPDLMTGIPIYSDLPHIHDYVVQADGAFDETIRGILNLKSYGQRVEIRVVLHKQTVGRLPDLANFITHNLLFVDHVALMGLEWMGFARANVDTLWIDPLQYQAELRIAVGILNRARINVSIYNSQLCLMDRSLWPFARKSISDWKQEYMPECDGCGVKERCAGFFSSAGLRYSDGIRPVAVVESATQT
jgi:His-Xaa-Ser system radical SAM maturase HxsC